MASFFHKSQEIMEIVNQINNIGKDVWPTSILSLATIWLLAPYLFNSPNPKTTVGNYLNNCKEITERTRLSNLFKG
jgi:hypothetical protein